MIGILGATATGLVVFAIAAPLRPRVGRSVASLGTTPTRATVGPLERVAAVRARRLDRRMPRPRAVASWCDHLARQIRSGATLVEAMTTTVPVDAATRRCTETIRLQVGRGRPITQTLDEHDVLAAGTHLDLALGVMATTARLGGSAAPAIDRTASVLRQRAADHDERAAQAAQARLSAHVMTAVPLAMLAVLLITDADVRTAVSGPVGSLCVGLGLALNAVGSMWMRRVVRSSP